MENKEEKLPDEVTEETFTEEGIVEFTTAGEYIASAYYALASVEDADTALMSKESEKRVKRIKRKCIKIIDICISEMYDELFESDDED
jgi:hypothetical protein